MSRIKDKALRDELVLGDRWKIGGVWDNEKQARDEVGWLVAHVPQREYLLVASTPRKKTTKEELNDDLPPFLLVN